jgi:hypothetical protein
LSLTVGEGGLEVGDFGLGLAQEQPYA